MAKYNYELKKKVVEAYYRGDGSYKYFAEKYVVKNKRQVLNCIRNRKCIMAAFITAMKT